MSAYGYCVPTGPLRWENTDPIYEGAVTQPAASGTVVVVEAPRPSRMTAAHRQRSYFNAITGPNGTGMKEEGLSMEDAADADYDQQQQVTEQASSPVRLKRRQSHLWALNPPQTTVRAGAEALDFDEWGCEGSALNVSLPLPLSTATNHCYVGVIEEILTELTESDPCRGIFANTLMQLASNESFA